MDFCTIEESSFEELIYGYRKNGNGYVCLWCGENVNSEAAAETHAADNHPVNERFRTLLGADSLLKFTPEEKALCALLFNEKDQKAIARKLGISYNSVRVKRSKLYYNEYIRSKAVYMLFDLIFSNQPKRLYNKKPRDKFLDLSHIPCFSALDSKITRFALNKEDLHTSFALYEYIHATVIILVAKRLSNSELFFLVCDKSGYNMENFSKEFFPIRKRYDCLGGHVERRDLLDGENYVSDTAFKNAAQRELKEELYLRKASIEPDKLQYLFPISYNNSDSVSGRYNNEVSNVYLYIIPEEADARVREKYIDSIGETVKLELPIRYFTYKELTEMFESGECFCDGLGRVVSHFIENPDKYKEIIEKQQEELLCTEK